MKFTLRGSLRVLAEDPMSQLPMMNPMFAMDMMKRNLAMVVPQLLIGALVNFFFSGFVAGLKYTKIPYSEHLQWSSLFRSRKSSKPCSSVVLCCIPWIPPTFGFSWVLTVMRVQVSSLSWYFLVLFGLRGLNTLLLGDTAPILDTAAMGMGTAILQMMKWLGIGGMGQQSSGMTIPGQTAKVCAAEKLNLELVEHEWNVAASEKRLISTPWLFDPKQHTTLLCLVHWKKNCVIDSTVQGIQLLRYL